MSRYVHVGCDPIKNNYVVYIQVTRRIPPLTVKPPPMRSGVIYKRQTPYLHKKIKGDKKKGVRRKTSRIHPHPVSCNSNQDINPLGAMGIYICPELCDVISPNSICLRKRKWEGAGGGNHPKVTAANSGCVQTF